MMAVWMKCRQRRRSLFLNPIQPSPAVGQCRAKKLDDSGCIRAAMGMFHLPFHFVRDDQELKKQLFPSSSRRVHIAAALAV
ncbi:MAG: hypothetical protein WBS33_19180 [Verrucomicrobiia bacterium]|jgi:hypothetical protein